MSEYLMNKEVDVREKTCCIMTRIYRSPEVILLSEYGKNADIWSLGVILAEMMASSTPYYKDDDYHP